MKHGKFNRLIIPFIHCCNVCDILYLLRVQVRKKEKSKESEENISVLALFDVGLDNIRID